MKLIPRVVLSVVLALSLTFSTLAQIKTDTGTYPENPKSITLPPAGGKFVDDLSGLSVMRLTDERDGRSFSTTYPVWNAFNKDATKVWLFEHGGPYYVAPINPTTLERTGPLQAVEPARGSFVDYETMNWSALDSDKGFLAVDCQIWAYKPSTKQYVTVADLRSSFPAGARFNQLYVSRDDNRFAAVVRSGSSGTGDYGVMLYELSSNTIKLNASFTDINGISMDKSGRYVLLVRNDPEGQVKQRIFDVDAGTVEVINSDANGKPDYVLGHNDTGFNSVVGGDQWRGAFTWRQMSTPHNVIMAWQYAPTGWINWHVALRADNEYWALVSTYGGTLTPAGVQTDGPFVREVFQLGVKEPFLGQFRRLVHTRANWTSQFYWDTPRAVISTDGTLVAYTSNNNQPSGTSRTDVFVVKIPAAPLPSGSPTPTPSPSPTPTPQPSPTPPTTPSPIPTPTPTPNPTPTPTPIPIPKLTADWPWPSKLADQQNLREQVRQNGYRNCWIWNSRYWCEKP